MKKNKNKEFNKEILMEKINWSIEMLSVIEKESKSKMPLSEHEAFEHFQKQAVTTVIKSISYIVTNFLEKFNRDLYELHSFVKDVDSFFKINKKKEIERYTDEFCKAVNNIAVFLSSLDNLEEGNLFIAFDVHEEILKKAIEIIEHSIEGFIFLVFGITVKIKLKSEFLHYGSQEDFQKESDY